VRVRQLTAGDELGPAILLLERFFHEEGFVTADEVIAENARAMVQIESCAILVAEVGDITAGVATLSMEFGIEFGWSAEMGDLYVVPDWRGKGIARALLLAGEQILKERGAKGYQVTVTTIADEHHDLKRFYAALGFEDEGRVILWKQLD
jgi:GNAT superfamily N-acetyltransferase